LVATKSLKSTYLKILSLLLEFENENSGNNFLLHLLFATPNNANINH